MKTKRIIVGITGATGAVYGVRTLEVLRELGYEAHAIISPWGLQTLKFEMNLGLKDLREMSTALYAAKDMSADLSSGSFRTDGMIVAPCSMSTLATIAVGSGTHLVHRAADVMLKEGRKLVLLPREAPLSQIHLENMLKLAKYNVCIFPPVPAFYQSPSTIKELVDHTVYRALMQLDIDVPMLKEWNGKTFSAKVRTPMTDSEQQI